LFLNPNFLDRLLDPEEIVTLLLLATLAIAWNWKFRH
jgi:hypothetical protein